MRVGERVRISARVEVRVGVNLEIVAICSAHTDPNLYPDPDPNSNPHLGDGGDLVGPQLLRLEDLRLRHRGRRSRVGDRGVMQTDAHLGGWEVKMGEMTGILGRLWGVMGVMGRMGD